MKITAEIYGKEWDEDNKVRIEIPGDFGKGVALVQARQVSTGIFALAAKRGRKWGVAKFYSQWVDRDTGACRGEFFMAYDLSDDDSAKEFAIMEEKA